MDAHDEPVSVDPADSPTPQELVNLSDPPLTLGSCLLRGKLAGTIIQEALLYFEGVRYSLLAWCIMPNHVHVVVFPLPGYEIHKILHSWKSYTSSQINRSLGLTGPLWERETFNHLIRSVEDLERFVHYTEQNPVEAGFVARAEDWRYSSRGVNFQIGEYQFVDPRTTPFAEIRSRGELPHLHKEGGTYFVTFRLLDAVAIEPRANA